VGRAATLPFLKPSEHPILHDSISEVIVTGSHRVFAEKPERSQTVAHGPSPVRIRLFWSGRWESNPNAQTFAGGKRTTFNTKKAPLKRSGSVGSSSVVFNSADHKQFKSGQRNTLSSAKLKRLLKP